MHKNKIKIVLTKGREKKNSCTTCGEQKMPKPQCTMNLLHILKVLKEFSKGIQIFF